MGNAELIACNILSRPSDPIYAERIRQFQGCPTLAVTPGGRIYLGWYSGGTREPHMDNYNLLIYSDDRGATWSQPLLIIPSSRERLVHALDIQLWTAPNGDLHVYWVQNNVEVAHPGDSRFTVDGFVMAEQQHAEWRMICRNPDDTDPAFGQPVCLDRGFLRCKPLALHDGRWIQFNYDQSNDRYGYSISDDAGNTYTHRYGGRKVDTWFDEAMAYERLDGSIRMLARTKSNGIAESFSYDRGETWTDGAPSGIAAPDTRHYIARLASGRLLLIYNDHPNTRTNMTVCLSEDDGATWKYKRCIDARGGVSYPDADEHDGRIYMTYDRDRNGAGEILFLSFTEADLINDALPVPQVISKNGRNIK